MVPGDEVMVKSSDGYHVEFPYTNIYEPDSRQGEITVCWFNGEESGVGERQGTGYPPDYHVGMRLVFFADNSTNSEGKHVFGNSDMRMVMPAETVHLFENLYPSTSGYTVKWVDEVRIYSGGYNGSTDLLPKSYQSKMDETYPAPPRLRPHSLLKPARWCHCRRSWPCAACSFSGGGSSDIRQSICGCRYSGSFRMCRLFRVRGG